MAPALSLALLSAAAAATTAAAAGCDDWPAAATFCRGGAKNFEPGVAYPTAKTTRGPSEASEADCCCACAADLTCNGWTLDGGDGGTCYLKADAGPKYAVKSKSAVSGIMPQRPPPPPYHPLYPTPKGAKSVLFLAVDDMRPSLGACKEQQLPRSMSLSLTTFAARRQLQPARAADPLAEYRQAGEGGHALYPRLRPVRLLLAEQE